LQNLTLESYNLGARIGDRVLVETNWSVEVKNGAGADIGMIGSYGTPALDVTLVNESFAVERLFYQIDAGGSHSLAISKNGRAWGWGSNAGILGDGSNTTSRLTPVSVAGTIKTFCYVSGGSIHSLAIDKNGLIWAWGANIDGRLGDNSTTNRLTPVSVAGQLKTFCHISAGTSHSLAIDKNGRAWAWASNVDGRLGDGSTTDRLTPVSVAGTVIKTFCHISAGTSHSLAIDKNGRAWGWGYNSFGRLGDNSIISRLTPVSVAGAIIKTFCHISAGNQHSVAIDKNGRAWAWGRGDLGQLGDGSTTASRLTPVSVGGTIIKTFCKITAGVSRCLAIDKNGLVWAWGSNTFGRLGDGSTTSRLTPVTVAGALKTFCHISAGNNHSIAVDKNGRAWGWGYNSTGQIGNGSTISSLTPVRVYNI